MHDNSHLSCMGLPLNLPSPVSQIDSALLRSKNITLHVKRDDLIHPIIQGNKWRKLKYNLELAKQRQQKTLLTFGGAFSNHIHATAAAGYCFGFETIGIIRGEAQTQLNPTLQDATDWGMQLHYVSRSDYRHKHEQSFIDSLKKQFGDFYLIPEGGSNIEAIRGCREIIDELNEDYDVICAATGTGATLAGIIAASNTTTSIIGFPALKNGQFLYTDIAQHLQLATGHSFDNWKLQLDYHFGGYAKTTAELIEFITSFEQQFDIALEPVYTGKMFYGIFDLIEKNHFKAGSKILAIHSGGLQGLRGYKLKSNDE